MKNKEFDCVEYKRKQQERLWLEAGESFDGLMKLLDKKRESNELLKYLINKRKNVNKVN